MTVERKEPDMPFDYIEMVPKTDLGLFQIDSRKSIPYMNRLFKPSNIKLPQGFPKFWTYWAPSGTKEFYQKIDLYEGRHIIQNSLWKYYHGHNARPFSISECYDACEKLSSELGHDVLNFELDHIEVGVYFEQHFDLISRLRASYQNSQFDAMKKRRSREVYGWHLQFNHFEIKIYDVSKKDKLSGAITVAPPGSYRFEIKYYSTYFLRKNGVRTMMDLFDPNIPLYRHWRMVTNNIVFKLFPQIPSEVKTSQIKNIMLFFSDAYPEFTRVVKNKGGGKTDLKRINESVKMARSFLIPTCDMNLLLIKELDRNLLL